MYIRTTRSGGRAYLQLVEGFREDGVVRQRIIANLGRLDQHSAKKFTPLICGLQRAVGLPTATTLSSVAPTEIEQAEAKPGFPATRAKFGAAVEGAARDLFAPMDDSEDAAPALNEAKQYIRDALAKGPKPSQELEKEALKGGIKRATLRRARVALGVRCEKRKLTGIWEWQLAHTELEQLAHENDNLCTQEMMSNMIKLSVDEQLSSQNDVLPEIAEGEL